MKNPNIGAYVQLHTAVLLFGITAILGKLITLDSNLLVWNRLWISVAGLLLLPAVWRGLKEFTLRDFLIFAGIGTITAMHWVTFYGSIKLGDNASITLACLATSTMFTGILEPIILKKPFDKSELFISFIVLAGIGLITGVSLTFLQPILVGLLSAFLAALFSVLNKKYGVDRRAVSVTTVELGAGWIALGVFIWLNGKYSLSEMFQSAFVQEKAPFNAAWGSLPDWFYLLILGLLCTSLAFVLALKALKHLTAFTSNLAVNLEPIYGMLLAILIFSENQDLRPGFYIGSALIILAVFGHAWLQRRKRKKSQVVDLLD